VPRDPETPGEGAAAPGAGTRRRLLVAALVVLGGVILARLLVGEVYRVREQSMHPGLRGGSDRIFVLKHRSDPTEDDRFSIYVYRTREGREEWGTLRVKRLVGLPGEVLDFIGGDLLVGSDRDHLKRVRRGERILSGMLIPVFSSRERGAARRFRLDSGSISSGADGALVVHSDRSGTGARAELLNPLTGGATITDDGVDSERRPVAGDHAVADLRIELVLEEVEGGGRLTVVHALSEESCEVRLTHRRLRVATTMEDGRERVLAERGHAGLPLHVRMETIDGRFRVLAGPPEEDLGLVYSGERETLVHAGESKVLLLLKGRRAGLRSFEVWRDVYYEWPPALAEVHKVRRGRVFLVGDNPRASRDSREDDDIPMEALVGRAVLIVWPPSRWRRL